MNSNWSMNAILHQENDTNTIWTSLIRKIKTIHRKFWLFFADHLDHVDDLVILFPFRDLLFGYDYTIVISKKVKNGVHRYKLDFSKKLHQHSAHYPFFQNFEYFFFFFFSSSEAAEVHISDYFYSFLLVNNVFRPKRFSTFRNWGCNYV